MERFGKTLGQGLAAVALVSVAVLAGSIIAGGVFVAVRAIWTYVL